MERLIEIKNMTKSFGNKTILKNVNMTINKGDSIAIIGHNGSGKSTFLKIICKLSSINEGEIKYYKKIKFNYVPERFPKMPITPRQYILKTGLIEGITKNEIEDRCSELFRKFFMEKMIDTPIKYLSKGSIQKVSVIQALITKPDILLLDEPLSGQDVDSEKVFIKLIDGLIKEGITVVMSCHDSILINSLSNLVYEVKERNIEKVDYLKASCREYDILVFNGSSNIKERYKDIKKQVEKIDVDENKIKLVVDKSRSNDILKTMLNYGYELRRMYSEDF
ncbi:ATP-binding cassette domain-containing protein [Clostridium felsineum]|uniref:ATP-binding cassette domain-containing protein n=1 Tax=Clostridium felsineum TaxID=36839 RepID=UPI00098CC803|nr:ATP-binding cassette domain-containing protein [Clostridium felsineum]MCR3761564.1 ATP-binding cassette domain-containing protein [Clostridium felsineum]URZ04052.1 Vitamin B12 import ATP-binding protein BtuD [Clostridium felsineum]